MIFAIILVGGATRLTESGLSITEWKPVSGVLPPLSEAAWNEEFDKYRQIPQYELMNAGMTLSEFRTIYLWEYSHRLVARLVGLAFVIPMLWFLIRRRMPARAKGPVFLLLLMLFFQAAIGWWMVTSGLTARTEVSQYRLLVHLMTALIMLALTVWTAASLLEDRRVPISERPRRLSRRLGALLFLAFLTAASGALVAGLRAGRIYNTFPLMGGHVVPPEYGRISPWWLNLFDNHAAVQFNHRVLAMLAFTLIVAAWVAFRRTEHAQWSRKLVVRMNLVLAAVTLQLLLGIATLLLAVPIALGVAHQAGAALLLTALVLALHANGEPSGRSAA
jgi:heme a synthase